MTEKCIRTNGDSSDKNLSEIEFRNVYELLKTVLRHKKLYLQAELMEAVDKYIKSIKEKQETTAR
jgi:thiamine kinase-like enzyme